MYFTKYYQVDEIKEDDIDGACNMHGRYEKCIQNFGRRKLRGRKRCKCEDNIRMYLRKIRWENVNWINLAQERDQWQSIVNTEIRFRVA
jgi:hypothetical protein